MPKVDRDSLDPGAILQRAEKLDLTVRLMLSPLARVQCCLAALYAGEQVSPQELHACFVLLHSVLFHLASATDHSFTTEHSLESLHLAVPAVSKEEWREKLEAILQEQEQKRLS